MELGSGFGSSTADTVVDVAARIQRVESRHLMMTDERCQTLEPKVALPSHFKRQFEPIISCEIGELEICGFLLLSEGPESGGTETEYEVSAIGFNRFYSKPRLNQGSQGTLKSGSGTLPLVVKRLEATVFRTRAQLPCAAWTGMEYWRLEAL